jgi:hypothetical protein
MNDFEPVTVVTIATGGRQKGAISNIPTANILTPCNNCMITKFQAGLIHMDGTSANLDTGLMLHHMVLLNGGHGERTKDATCGNNPLSLPHVDVKTVSATTERIWSSGNERTIGDLTQSDKSKYGYYVGPKDKFGLITELMNMNMDKQEAYLTLTYEYVEGLPGPDWTMVKPIWLDVNQCSTSEVSWPGAKEKKPEQKFSLTAKDWKFNFAGRLHGAAGHIHDAGTDVEMIVNGKTVCDSKFLYGTKPEFTEKTDPSMGTNATGNAMGGMKHISQASICYNFGSFVQGDKLGLKANYDATLHMPMTRDGEPGDVMGIAIIFAENEAWKTGYQPPK